MQSLENQVGNKEHADSDGDVRQFVVMLLEQCLIFSKEKAQ